MLEFVGLKKEMSESLADMMSFGDSEIFTFALPPESEDFTYGQRVNETKTFGGSVFDDYGNDTFKIVISGSTVNNDKKFIYKGTAAVPGYLTGEQEIFKLRDLLYKGGKLKNLEDKKVYLYDLSKMNAVQIAVKSGSKGSWWKVHITSLKIKRAKDKPFTYNYTLEMTAYYDEKKLGGGLFSNIASAVSSAMNIVSNIQTAVATIEMAVATVGSIRKGLENCKQIFESLQSGNFSALGKVSMAVGLGGSVERTLLGTSMVNSLYNSAKSLMNDVKTLSRWEDIGTSDIVKSGSVSEDEKFTVTFNANGGHFEDDKETYEESVSYSQCAAKPSAIPTRENYEFAYWHLLSEPNKEFDFDETPIKTAVTLYAKWTQTSAVVSFNSRGGSAVASQTVAIGGKATKPETIPTRQGYIFTQWCSNFAATIAFNFETPINADTTLYAAWERVTALSVDFESNGGSAVESQSVERGGKVLYPVTPTKENYVFAGWFTDEELTEEYDFSQEVTSSFTLYAKWTHSYCDVVFDAKGGSPAETQKVVIGGKAAKPEDPAKEGYTFAFWCSDSGATNEFDFNTPINADTTLYARWVLNEYTVAFNSNGGSAVESQTVSHGGLAVFPAMPEKEGYSFYKWCDKYLENEFDFSTPIERDMTLFARWFGNSYQFTFESNGGTAIEPQTVENGKQAQRVVPAKEHNTFVGWHSDEELTKEFDFSTPIEHDTTVWAKWKVDQFTATFESNGGSAVDAQTVDYGTALTRPQNPTKAGKSFAGWHSDSELTQEYDFSAPVTQDITLYAKWS